MKENNNTISTNQLTFILALTMIGTGILRLPRSLAEAIPYDHWIILLAAGLVVTIVIAIYARIIELKPGTEYFEILCDSLSRPIAYAVSLVYIIYFIVFIGLVTRLFGEVIKVYLLIKTPIEVINISLLVCCIYQSRKGVKVLGRLSELLFPITIAVVVFLFSLSFIKTDFRNLLPVFEITFTEVFRSIPIAILSFLGVEVILFFGSNLEKPEESIKLTTAVIVVTLFYLLILAAAFAQFGPIQMKKLVWPTLDLFDTIELPGLFIENVQVVVMGAWVIAVFTTTAPLYLACTNMVKSAIGFRDHSSLTAPLLPLIYFASLIPRNLAHLYDITDKFIKYFAGITAVGIPLIVLISLLIQTRSGKGAETNA